MNKVTLIMRDGTTKTIWNVTYILYRSDVSLTVVENHNVQHSFFAERHRNDGL
jgi:hypothetical protein